MSIELISKEGTSFIVSEEIAKCFGTVKNLFEDTSNVTGIPLPEVESKTLRKVIEYAKYHLENGALENPAEPTDWDKEFLKCDNAMLFSIINATNYLNYQELLDVAIHGVVSLIRGKSPSEIRAHFNIPNDFTAEEEEQIRKENEWIEE